MKRLFYISIIIFISSTGLFAQTVFDAVKAADSDLGGSARYSSMAGAFGALGGDVSAIKDNPAGLGVFRKSELSLTANTLFQNSKSKWDGVKDRDSRIKLGFNNVALVLTTPFYRTSGLVSSNFSFNYNKLKNFNRNVSIKGTVSPVSITDYYALLTPINVGGNIEFKNDNYSWMSVMAYEGYLIDPIYDENDNLIYWSSALKKNELVLPDYTLHEYGGIDEYAFAWAGNISNKLFLGASINIRSLNYSLHSIYNEDFTGGGGMTMQSFVDIKGTGVNANFGAIYLPVDFLRIGASFQTPTIYSMAVTNFASLYADWDEKRTIEPKEANTVKSSLYTPLQVNGGVAFLFGRKGLLSAEYVYKNYTGMYFADKDNGSSSRYSNENGDINRMLNNTSSIKIGGEYKVTDNFAVRAGYAYMSPTQNKHTEKIPYIDTARTDMEYFINNGSHYITTGFGYRDANWYVDLAFTNQRLKETFYAFNPHDFNPGNVTPANVITNFNNVVVTLGLRF